MIKRHIFFVLAMMVLYASGANAQSVEILQVDADNYPEINFFFKVLDADGNEVRDLDENEVVVKDNNIARAIGKRSPDCPPPGRSMFSIIFVIDESQSMREFKLSDGRSRLDGAIEAAKLWIEELPEGRFECATYSFHSYLDSLQGFTDDKSTLRNSFSRMQKTGLLTDYNCVFTWDFEGTRGIGRELERAKYPSYLIFITDGKHRGPGGGIFRKFDAKDSMETYETKVYSLVINDDIAEAGDATYISSATDGKSYSVGDAANRDVIKDRFDAILAEINETGPPIPCNIEYDTDCDGGRIELFITRFGISAFADYVIPENVKPYLEITPRDIILEDATFVPSQDIQLTVTARNNFVDIKDYIASDPRFQIVGWGDKSNDFRLQEDESFDITVRFNRTDDSCTQGTIDVEQSACDGKNINLQAYLLPYAEDLDCGTQGLGAGAKINAFNQVICNNTCSDLTINTANFQGGNSGDFVINPSVNGAVIPKGGCLELTIEFTPGEVDLRETELVVNTVEFGDIRSRTYGMGSGKPGISSPNPIEFPDLNCTRTSEDTTIFLANDGPVELLISSVSMEDGTHFQIVAPEPTSIPANGSVPLTINFAPGGYGLNLEDKVLVEHNGDGSPYEITVRGDYHELNYTATPDVVDFGVVCVGTPTQVVTIENIGTIAANITGSINAPFNLPEPSFIVTNTHDFVVEIPTDNPGVYEETLTFVDDLCNETRTVTVKAIVFEPRIDDNGGFDITTNVNVPQRQTRVIRNLSDDILRIESITPQDPQFTFISSNPPLAADIPPNGTIEIVLEYLPTTTDIVNSTCLLSGQPCDFELSVPMLGNPDQARVTIESVSLTGYIGEDVNVEVVLKDPFKYPESGTESITFDLAFDDKLLKHADGPSPVTITVDKSESSAVTSGLGLLVEVPFTVLEPGDGTTQCSLEILNPESDKNNVQFVIENGTFTLNPAAADISIDKYEAAPGEVFDVVVKISNAQNLVESVNKSISLDLRFNAHIIVPFGNTPMGLYQDGERTITLSGLPVLEDSEYDLVTLQFQAVLGNVEETTIFIEQAASEEGFIKFTPENGEFKLVDLCENTDGTKRFFDPFGQAELELVSPNPASGSVTVKFEVIEEGTTKLTLINTTSGIETVLYERSPGPGEHTEIFDLSDYESGAYLIKMKTYSQEFTKKFYIVK